MEPFQCFGSSMQGFRQRFLSRDSNDKSSCKLIISSSSSPIMYSGKPTIGSIAASSSPATSCMQVTSYDIPRSVRFRRRRDCRDVLNEASGKLAELLGKRATMTECANERVGKAAQRVYLGVDEVREVLRFTGRPHGKLRKIAICCFVEVEMRLRRYKGCSE